MSVEKQLTDDHGVGIIAAGVIVSFVLLLLAINYTPTSRRDVSPLIYQIEKDRNDIRLQEEADEAHKLYLEVEDRRQLDPLFER